MEIKRLIIYTKLDKYGDFTAPKVIDQEEDQDIEEIDITYHDQAVVIYNNGYKQVINLNNCLAYNYKQ